MLVQVEPRREKHQQEQRKPEHVELQGIGLERRRRSSAAFLTSGLSVRSASFGASVRTVAKSPASKAVTSRLSSGSSGKERVNRKPGLGGHAAFSSGLGPVAAGRTPISSSNRVLRSTCHAAFSESLREDVDGVVGAVELAERAADALLLEQIAPPSRRPCRWAGARGLAHHQRVERAGPHAPLAADARLEIDVGDGPRGRP